VGWNFARQIARFNEVWIITRTNNRRPIEAALAREPLQSAHFVYFDLPKWTRLWKRGKYGLRPYYFLWQLGIYFLARRLHRRAHFDVVHHITFVNFWLPSFLPMLRVPFVLGPVGGGESAPKAFWWSFSLHGKIYELLRDLGRTLAQFNPFVRLAARRAAVALATTDETRNRLKRLGCQTISVLSQVGVTENEIRSCVELSKQPCRNFRVVSVGRFLHWKGFELGLRGFALFRAHVPASEYWLIGDGPEKGRLEALARKLQLGDSVRLLGNLPREQALEKMAACDVLLNPSLHDSGSFVCAEAMAAGVPVICLDLGGPAVLVTKETGVKIPAISPPQAVRDLAAALSQLAQDHVGRDRLGRAARQHVQENFNWNSKGERVNHLYSANIHVVE
jgi:glycosyltransferase involved in cell wall biosynthesis